MPVLSMSMRALIGIVQAFDTPGSFSASFSWLTSSSGEMRSGVNGRNTGFSHSGAHEEYQVGTRRHSDVRLERDDRLEHRERRRVRARVGPAGLAEHAVHLGELLDDPVGHLQQPSAPRRSRSPASSSACRTARPRRAAA